MKPEKSYIAFLGSFLIIHPYDGRIISAEGFSYLLKVKLKFNFIGEIYVADEYHADNEEADQNRAFRDEKTA